MRWTPLSPPTGEAFAIVRKLLLERPRGFQDLLRSGLAEHPSSHNPRPAQEPRNPRRLSSGRWAKQANVTYVPEGHPFVSSNFLKHRILPILQTHGLVQKKARIRIPWPETVPEEDRPEFAWFITPPREPQSTDSSTFIPNESLSTSSSDTTLSDPSSIPSKLRKSRESSSMGISDDHVDGPTKQKWDAEEHWDRLVKGEHPAILGGEVKELAREGLQAAKEERLSKIGERRTEGEGHRTERMEPMTEREMWEWKDREPGLTTRLERGHLNTRRQNARPAKERREREGWGVLQERVQSWMGRGKQGDFQTRAGSRDGSGHRSGRKTFGMK
ncbi:hypothetical protein TREMEDRAFT_60997 [Tremella mesenterica DSM 1558]|uniref:uncharacterized protein n=1 Tax=Tremella mesenterica (strain ATCC 24925 / CBS 8224 / DSM 1558 / NBRC 9311 / NRRL Y-6157 / RJB 2259-6 / UBC 559-6) TaxID=578456 RepID=UPI0003F494A2|nr:uncharacterized protein TREMEDRAFT_60997 [Tremella mesenterica DSM 1558]EIW70494.1 hypothetical protein TREMEDRAFT_60997 [Tremella mesenterica DSM 1558]